MERKSAVGVLYPTGGYETLGRIGHPTCFQPLADALQNQDFPPIVRYYAAYALGLLGDARGIESLQRATKDSHGWVAQMAAESLKLN